MDVSRALEPAFKHMVRILFKPFKVKTWLSLGFTFLVAYGLGGGGGNLNLPRSGPVGDGGPLENVDWADVTSWIAVHWPVLLAAGVVLVCLGILMTWLSSVFQFIYVEKVARETAGILEPFSRLRALGRSYFLWRVGFGVIVTVALAGLVGLPLAFVFVSRCSGVAKVLVIVWSVMVGIIIILATALIGIFAKDFVVPAMYVRNVGVLEGWRTVLPLLKSNIGQTVLYVLMLMLIALGIGILSIPVVLVVLIAVLFPLGILAAVGYLIGHTLGLSWTAPVIGAVAAIACVVLACLIFLVVCILQPAHVFRRSFSLVVLGGANAELALVRFDEDREEVPPEGE